MKKKKKKKEWIPRQIVIKLPEGQDEITFPCYDYSDPLGFLGIAIRTESVRVGESKIISDVSGSAFRYTVVRKLDVS